MLDGFEGGDREATDVQALVEKTAWPPCLAIKSQT